MITKITIKEKYGCCGIKIIASLLDEHYDEQGELTGLQQEIAIQILKDFAGLKIL